MLLCDLQRGSLLLVIQDVSILVLVDVALRRGRGLAVVPRLHWFQSLF